MSRRREVILAVKGLVQAALPDAEVSGFDGDYSEAFEPGAGGNVIGLPGLPGEPETDLGHNGSIYNWSHPIPIDVTPPRAAADPAAALDAMLEAIGTAILADRTLGGLCHWLDVSAPDEEDENVEGGAPLRWANIIVTADYSTSNPLA